MGLEVGGGKIEIWYINAHTYVISEIIPFNTKPDLILLMSAYFLKKFAFFWQNSPVTQSDSVRAMLQFF